MLRIGVHYQTLQQRFIIRLDKHGNKAVSYTHLDVYKRQIEHLLVKGALLQCMSMRKVDCLLCGVTVFHGC